MSWKAVSFILASKKRQALLALLETPRTPMQLARLLSMSQPNVSLKLKDLQDNGMVECVNPEDRKGRIYRLTVTGTKVLKELKKMERN